MNKQIQKKQQQQRRNVHINKMSTTNTNSNIHKIFLLLTFFSFLPHLNNDSDYKREINVFFRCCCLHVEIVSCVFPVKPDCE